MWLIYGYCTAYIDNVQPYSSENPNAIGISNHANLIVAVLVVTSFVERIHKANGILFAREWSFRDIGNDTIDDCCDLSGES